MLEEDVMIPCILILVAVGREVDCITVVGSTTKLVITVLSSSETVSMDD